MLYKSELPRGYLLELLETARIVDGLDADPCAVVSRTGQMLPVQSEVNSVFSGLRSSVRSARAPDEPIPREVCKRNVSMVCSGLCENMLEAGNSDGEEHSSVMDTEGEKGILETLMTVSSPRLFSLDKSHK